MKGLSNTNSERFIKLTQKRKFLNNITKPEVNY